MKRIFDHIDLRVSSLEAVRGFYEVLLPALGFTARPYIEGWLHFEAEDEPVTQFFGIMESSGHIPNENRIAFWAESMAEVDRLTEIAEAAGAQELEGPLFEAPHYYASFFNDPSGNRLEICYRTQRGG